MRQETSTVALPTSIETLLSGQVVEWARIEFKSTWDAQASLKTICAFANDLDNWGGGYVVLGICEPEDADKHVGDEVPPIPLPGGRLVVGVPAKSVDAWLKDMLNKCKLIQPAYLPIAEVCTYKGKTCVMIWCPGGSQRPYSSPKSVGKDKKGERVRWIRKMASTVEPSHEEERELYNLANNVPFDDRICHAAEVSDLSMPLIKAYLHEVGSSLYEYADSMDFTELCRNVNIVDGPPEYTKPKNVGLLFFSMDPERFFPYSARIEVVELPDGEGGDRIFEHTFTGPLHQQLREALAYLRNNVIEETVLKLPDQAEAQRFFNYPYAALEEALANAVYHKGYDTREPVEVRVLPDRIEVLSHPGADRSITLANLREYRAVSRRYRNRRIGDFLKELHLTEGRNTGIHKMLRALDRNGSPKPLVETDEDRLYFLVTLFARGPHQTSASKPSESVRRTAERRARLLAYFSEHPTSSTIEASAALGIARSTVSRDISELKLVGRLAHEGPRRGGSWVVS